MAPEVVNDIRGYSLKADIWSVGCILLAMLTGKHPHDDLLEDMHVLNRVRLGAGAYAILAPPSTILPDARRTFSWGTIASHHPTRSTSIPCRKSRLTSTRRLLWMLRPGQMPVLYVGPLLAVDSPFMC